VTSRHTRKSIYPTAGVLLLALLLALTVLLPGLGSESEASAAPAPGGALLQFTSAGHVFAFTPESVTIASASHMLCTEFVGANAVSPQAEQTGQERSDAVPGVSTAVPGDNLPAQPLGRVIYHDLWDGIDLAYEAAPGSIAKSTYYLDDGDLASCIHLSYNRPLRQPSLEAYLPRRPHPHLRHRHPDRGRSHRLAGDRKRSPSGGGLLGASG